MKIPAVRAWAANRRGARRMADRMIGEGVGFERIRRITGYLVGKLERFNNAKRAEERDRVKHGMSARFKKEQKQCM